MSHIIGVLIVDDHPIVREGLHALISTEPTMRIVGEASNGMDADETPRARHAPLTLVSPSIPVAPFQFVMCKAHAIISYCKIRFTFHERRIV